MLIQFSMKNQTQAEKLMENRSFNILYNKKK